MRLIKSQARATKYTLKAAEALVTRAIQTGDVSKLNMRLEELLGKMPREAYRLVAEIALYEKEFVTKKMTKYKAPVKKISDKKVLETVKVTPVAVSLDAPKVTIQQTYLVFATKKRKQLMQIVGDAKVLKEEPEVTITKVSNIINGLFTAQNLVLAGIAVVGTANIVRSMLVDKVKWVIDLELNNCPYCEARDGEIYDSGEVEGDIPLHANCGCTLVPVDEDGNEI